MYNRNNQSEIEEKCLTNARNFIDLLNYQIRCGEKALENHLRYTQQNPKYIFQEIQNDLILCCRNLIVEIMLAEVKKNKYYTIIADKATNCSLKVQITLIFRFVDKSSTIREEFLSLL